MKSTFLPVVRFFVVALLSTLAGSTAVAADLADNESAWPRRVLVTNDNGIDDIGLVELARALAKVTETHVVATTTDRSGTSNLITAVRTGEFRVERSERTATV